MEPNLELRLTPASNSWKLWLRVGISAMKYGETPPTLPPPVAARNAACTGFFSMEPTGQQAEDLYRRQKLAGGNDRSHRLPEDNCGLLIHNYFFSL